MKFKVQIYSNFQCNVSKRSPHGVLLHAGQIPQPNQQNFKRRLKTWHYHQRGMVFISVLIFLVIVNTVTLLLLQQVELDKRAQYNFYRRAQNVEIAQYALQKAYQDLKAHKKTCQISRTAGAALLAKPESFWHQSQVCSGEINHYHYQYVLERLESNDSKKIYWKITARSEGIKNQHAVVVLQRVVSEAT